MSEPRKQKTPQPFVIVTEVKDLTLAVTGYTRAAQQPPPDVTDVNELAKWLRKSELPANSYRVLRDVGPLTIATEQKPVTKVSIG